MQLNLSTAADQMSFRDFLFKQKRNKMILLIALGLIIIQWSVFKYYYPFASYIHGDSFSYINAAMKNLSINTYMVGYSNFLRLVSVFSKSDLFLVTIQYLLLQASAIFLLFTIFYFNKPLKAIQALLLLFIICNPLSWYLPNLVSSDCIFVALSILWLSLLLWMIFRATFWATILHILILFIAFTVRYNALIYPFISIFIIIVCKYKWTLKIGFSFLTIITCSSFVFFTSYKYKQLTGTWQYSPFSGWQWANNALYTYRYINKENRKLVPSKFERLDNNVRAYFDSTRDVRRFPTENIMASTFYMWSPGMPLVKYKDSLFRKDSTVGELKKWASMGPLYQAYGIYIIKKYPKEYFRYFIWPNANKYYAPPVEFLQEYNSGYPDVNEQTKEWFRYKSTKVSTRTKSFEVILLNFYPILSGVINIIMLSFLICFTILKGWNIDFRFNKILLLNVIIWILNAGFTIFASSPALRFQAFPILLTTITVTLGINWMIKLIHISKLDLNQTLLENKTLTNETLVFNQSAHSV